MRTKKLFSLLLAVLMLCSLSVSAFAAETAQASVPVVLPGVNSVSPLSVSVPACLPVTVLDGYVVTASNAVIENHAQSGAVQVVAVDVQPGEYELRLKYLVDSLDRNEKGLRGVVWLENRDGGRSSVYSTTLRRNRTENFTRRFTVDTTHRRLHLDFLDFREKPLRPSVTVTGLEIDYIPTTSVAVDSLYRQQLDLRIFADEFLRAAIQADSL